MHAGELKSPLFSVANSSRYLDTTRACLPIRLLRVFGLLVAGGDEHSYPFKGISIFLKKKIHISIKIQKYKW